jgi:hypothetical protein
MGTGLNFPGFGLIQPSLLAAICPFALGRPLTPSLVQMAEKIRRLAGNGKLGDAGAVTSLGNPYCCVLVGRETVRDGRQPTYERKPK